MIRFACSSCGRLISVDEKHSGKKGKCPKCGSVVVVPERSTIIEFPCGSCGHKISVPERQGGKKGACPKCKNPVVVPSLKKVPAEDAKTTTITCSMCGQIVAVPEGSSGELIECTACGIYIERSSERIPAASAESDTSIPPTADEDIERESPEEPEGVDRRLIILISAVAVIAVVGLVLLVVMLRPSRPQEEVADTGETLRIISWEGNLPDDNIYEFEEYVSKKYNETIKVERIYASEEKDFFNAIYGRKADVSLAPHNFIKDEWYNFIGNKLILPINLENIPNYKTLIPTFKHMEGHVENGSVYCVPFGAGPHGFYYNADIVKTEPKSWSLFWDEQYKGKYAISREHAENNIYITVMGLGNVMNNKTTAIGPLNAAIYNKERGTITNLSNGEFRSRLKTLAENADHHYRIHEKADQIEHLAFSTGWGTAIGELNRKGKNWKVANPSEGTMGWLDGYMIGYSLSQQDDKRDYKLLRRVAEDWVNFTISPRFQLDVMVRFWSAYPTNLSVAPLLTPEELVASHLDDLSYFDTNLVLLPKLTRRQRDRMNGSWRVALFSATAASERYGTFYTFILVGGLMLAGILVHAIPLYFAIRSWRFRKTNSNTLVRVGSTREQGRS